MRTKMLVLILFFMSAASPLIDNSTAQGSMTAAVDLECIPPNGASIDLDVSPGSTLAGFTTCTVSNPTVHVEKISITVTADGLVVAAPGSVTVAAGGEEDFQVAVRAESRMYTQARTLVVEATVQEISGVPPPNSAYSTSSNIISILQFAEFSVEMMAPVVELEVGSDYQLEYNLYNTGNGFDKFNIELSDDEFYDTSFALPAVALQVEPYAPPARFQVMVSAPDDGLDWETDSDGVHTMEIEIKISVESDLGCQNGDCLKTTMTQKIIFYENQTAQDDSRSGVISNSMDNKTLVYGGSGAGVILLLILFVVMRRKK